MDRSRAVSKASIFLAGVDFFRSGLGIVGIGIAPFLFMTIVAIVIMLLSLSRASMASINPTDLANLLAILMPSFHASISAPMTGLKTPSSYKRSPHNTR